MLGAAWTSFPLRKRDMPKRLVHSGGIVRGCDAGRHHRSKRATQGIALNRTLLPGPQRSSARSERIENTSDEEHPN